MEEFDDLGYYNGDVEHDMWVDYTNYEYTGTPDVFDDDSDAPFDDDYPDD